MRVFPERLEPRAFVSQSLPSDRTGIVAAGDAVRMTGKLCTEELTNLELVVAGKPERPAGDLACYGFWDFGDAFGNDQFMCGSCGDSGNGESAKATGCTIETPACRSGKAVARRAIDVYTPWHKTASATSFFRIPAFRAYL